jgi:hypothetical protein
MLIFCAFFAAGVVAATYPPNCVAPASEWRLNMPCGCDYRNMSLGDFEPSLCIAGTVSQVEQDLRCVAETSSGARVYCSPKSRYCERSIARDLAAPVARCVAGIVTLDLLTQSVQRELYQGPQGAEQSPEFNREDYVTRYWTPWHAALLNNGSSDDCGSEPLVFTTPGFPYSDELLDCAPAGLVNVTLVVADRAARTSRCVATVNVINPFTVPRTGELIFVAVNAPLTLSMFGGTAWQLQCRKDVSVSISPDKISCANVNRVTLVSVRISGGATHESVHEVFASDPTGVCGKATTVCPAPSAPPCAAGLHGVTTPDGTYFCFEITPTNVCRLVSSSSPLLALNDDGFACVNTTPRAPNGVSLYTGSRETRERRAVEAHFDPLIAAASSAARRKCAQVNWADSRTNLTFDEWVRTCPESAMYTELWRQFGVALLDVERSCFGGHTRLDCTLFNLCPPSNRLECEFLCDGEERFYRNKCGAYCSCKYNLCEECPAVCERVACPEFCVANPLPTGAAAVVGVAAPNCQIARDASGAISSLDVTVRVPRTIFRNVTGPPTREIVHAVSYRACASLRIGPNAWSFPSQMLLVKVPETKCEGASGDFAVADATLAPPAADVATPFVSVNAMLGIALALLVVLTCVIIVVQLRQLSSFKAIMDELNQQRAAASASTRQSRRRSRRLDATN